MKQKDIFLNSEADAWLSRNLDAINDTEFDLTNPIISAFDNIASTCPTTQNFRVLEIGCGEGSRLHWMSKNWDFSAYGIEPSAKAVALAKNKGIQAIQGTADQLPYDNNFFDVIIYGFCLYLCDREDLFKIASEANRVLKNCGWVLIHDFFSQTPVTNKYHHKEGVHSFKMDYRSLFGWHPDFTCYSHSIANHGNRIQFADDPENWVATSVLRKKRINSD